MISIISGVTGQDGSYLAELLLSKGEKVIGFSRRTAVHSTSRIDHLMSNENFTYLEGDITDQQFIWKLISDYKSNKYFNLGAQSHVHTSFNNPKSTFDIDLLGVLTVLEAIRTLSPETRFYQASTSEMFGSNVSYEQIDDCLESIFFTGNNKTWRAAFQDESTPFAPNSPYAIAKLAAHNLVRLYRESYGLKCCSGILFNHESPRRGENFVTQKIIKWIVNFEKWIKQGSDKPLDKLRLGNLDASRDWGHAKDYVVAMDLLISQDKMIDCVVGTGETYTIREFLTEAFSLIGIDNWKSYVIVDPKFFRPSEVPYLKSKPDLIKSLGWSTTFTFKDLVKDMYTSEKAKSL